MEENLTEPTSANLWFAKGLRFHCTGCGKCCTGSPGYVFLSPTDLSALTSHFKMDETTFLEKYTYQVDEKISLIDRPGSDECVFLQDNKCSVYENRPQQCRTFPWWLHILKDEKSWQRASSHCEGINHPDAPLVPANHIAAQQLTYLDNLLEQNFSSPS